jgi:ATP-binding cassette subfamily B protein
MNQTGTIRKILRYLRRYRLRVALSLFLAALSAVLTLSVPVLTGNAIDLILSKGQVDFPGLFVILQKIAAVTVLTAAAGWVMSSCNNFITYSVVKDIREDAFAKLEILPLRYLDAHSHGDLVSRVIADVDTFADGLLMGFTQVFSGVVTILGTLLFMMGIHVPIALAVVCVTPVSFLAARFIAGKTHSMFRRQSETRGEQTAFVEEMLGSLKVVKAFSQEKQVRERFTRINERLGACSLRAVFYSSITNPATRFVNGLVYVGVGVFGALTAVGGGISVGRLSSFLSYANQYTKPFNEISGVVTELQNAVVCASRIFELLDQEPQAPDPPDAKVLDQGIRGAVSLRNLSFRYAAEKKLIEDFSLEVSPGMRVAIVGPTGCGKTTVINLLLRFYEADSGSLRVDQTDVRRITRGSLRAAYGMVLQETWLRAGTIRENICIGKETATEEEVLAAAKAAYAHSFIKRLPSGYDTVIGEDGGSLSQGQKQLLCIARVMLCLPPMLILDEATSSIDIRTEQKIQAAFRRMMEGRTSFIVAHRLSTVREADVILVMNEGNVIEQGSHKTLLQKGGFYARLYQSQFAE